MTAVSAGTGGVTGDFVAELARARLMAIIRGAERAPVVEAALALLEEGVRFVEIALTTPGACAAIEEVRGRAPQGTLVGAGTVLTAGDVADVVAAGAQFAVTPAVVESVEAAARRGLPVAAGALSATEVLDARRRGADVVKLFPASLGGPAYLRALRDPLPDVPLMAVGGVGLEDVPGFLAAGALGVGVGGPLVGDAARGGDLTVLRERARAYVLATAP